MNNTAVNEEKLISMWWMFRAAKCGRRCLRWQWTEKVGRCCGGICTSPRIAQRDRACSKQVYMTSIADSSVIIQTSSESVPSPPCWLGEVVLLVEHLRKQGVLAAIDERVRFARRRFGQYEVIDFLAVLFGYAISGERTLEAFYEQLAPFAEPFMALFNREQLPSRSALSRFRGPLHPSGC